ncbi:hypothetical protein PNEG_01284 [Pneumocystis murina B123]|uniref:Uncharacterized protein n=1 Tax=Pneumocystis murina (strain B123) TaxID=1069680 RepID=M7PJD9_PNEMU|nr:hypothetical protein PNEG_01284 [Pneumocystis murina B123]EMR10579.1 hypothetical protein PNEG_01284 [Pneumocystis murina B123]
MFLLPISRKIHKKQPKVLKEIYMKINIGPETLLNKKFEESKKIYSIRKHQIKALHTILHLSLLRGEFSDAHYAFSILIRCREIRLYDIWDIGLEILRHIDPDQQERYLKGLIAFYQTPIRSDSSKDKVGEELLKALILLYIEKEEFEKLLNILEDYLLSAPYSENSSFYEYAGMAALELSEKTTITTERKQFYERAEYMFQKAREKNKSISYRNVFNMFSNKNGKIEN